MKKTLILTVIVISATLLCGCQEQQLADCQENTIQLQQTIDQQKADCQENIAKLQQTIEKQKAAIVKAEKATERSASVTNELLLEGERTKKENKALKKENAGLTKENAGLKKDNAGLKKEVARLKKELSRTPEERANIRKGIEQLMQLQKESAERFIKAKEAKEAGQN